MSRECRIKSRAYGNHELRMTIDEWIHSLNREGGSSMGKIFIALILGASVVMAGQDPSRAIQTRRVSSKHMRA